MASSSFLDRLNPSAPIAAVRPQSPRVIALIGGKGGVGTSVIAAGVAQVAGEEALLLDLDALGGGIDLVLGAENAPGQRWPELCHVRGSMEPDSIHPAQSPLGVHFISHTRSFTEVSVAAVTAVIQAAKKRYSLIIVDLPSHLPDPALLSVIDQMFVVVTGDVRACASAAATVSQLRPLHPHISCIVRTSPDAVRIAEFLGLPLAAEVLWEPRLADDIEKGLAPASRKRGQIYVGVEQVLQTLTHEASIPRRRRAS